MRVSIICVTLAFAAICVSSPVPSNADYFLDFEDVATGAMFAGDSNGDTAGPFDLDGLPMTITTVSTGAGSLSSSTFGLGLDSGGGDPDTESFNIGETWSFTTNLQVALGSFEIGGLQSEETFDVRSDDWINLDNVVTGSGVTYDAATGTFTVTDGPANDLFTLAELTGGRFLTVNPGVAIEFGNLTSTFGPNDDVEIENITFQIPEPGSSVVLIAVAMLVRRRRKI